MKQNPGTPAANTGHPLRSLREPNVRIFFGGIVMSNAGTWAQLTVLILLVRQLGGEGLELGIIAATQFLPLLVLGLYAGAIADRIDRHKRTIQLQAAMGVQALILGVIDWLDFETLPLLYALNLGFGMLTAFDNPTRRTLVTELVPPEQLNNVLSLSTSVMTGSRIFGPAIGALLATSFGTHWAFLLNGLTYLVFLAAMMRLDTTRFHHLEKSPRSATPVRDGLREVWADPVLRVTVIVFALIATFAFNNSVGFPLIITERLMEDDELFGFMVSVMSIGNVAGALFVARLVVVSQRMMYVGASALALSLGAFSFSTSTAVALVLVVPLGFTLTLFLNSANMIIQQRTSAAIRSRVMALIGVIFLGSTPIGGPITGIIGDTFGALWANLYGALIAATSALLGLVAVRAISGSFNPPETTSGTDAPTA
ncbi:MAG: MFS transporter [Acidimicrobiales bacterium]